MSSDLHDPSLSSSSRKRLRPTPSVATPSGAASAGGYPPPPGSSTTSTTPGTTTTTVNSLDPETQRAAHIRDPTTRITALNDLLLLSSSHDKNYAFNTDQVLRALAEVAMVDCLQWPGPVPLLVSSPPEQQPPSYTTYNSESTPSSSSPTLDTAASTPQFGSKLSWHRPPTLIMEKWIQHCQRQWGARKSTLSLEQIKTLEVILVILRNLSFVGGNLRLLAYVPDIWALLLGGLYQASDKAQGLGSDEVSSSSSSSSSAASTMNPTAVSSSGGGGSISSSSSSSLNPANATNAPPGFSLTVALASLQTLINLAPHLDLSGQQLLCDRLFYAPLQAKDGPSVPQTSDFGQMASGQWGFGGLWLAKRLDAKEDTVEGISKEFILSLTLDYLVAVWSIFPALSYVLTEPLIPRMVVLVALDLLQELINHARVGVVGAVDPQDHPDELPLIRAVLVNMPDALLNRLMDFLYVPRLGPDSLDYIDPVHNIVTRVTTLKLLMGYDATVDTDLRDRALDVLVPLLELDSPRMARRVGIDPATGITRPRLLEALVPILTTKVGRNEASLLTTQLLRELAKAPENRPGLLYIQGRLIELATKEPRVSQLVWNHLFAVPSDQVEEDDGEGDDDEEEDHHHHDDGGEKEGGASSGPTSAKKLVDSTKSSAK